MAWAWLVYGVASAIILSAGFRLCRETDALAARWGWTRTWAGLVVLATVTSLPELFTGLSSVLAADTPRIALGDLAGSLAFNLAVVALLAIVVRRHLFRIANPGQARALAHAGLLTGSVLVATLAAPALPAAWRPFPLLAAIPLYGLVMWDLHRKGLQPAQQAGVTEGRPRRLALDALLIVLAAGALPYAGAEIADTTGLGRTFVGGLLVAVSTSLPEVAVTYAAWRIGAPDLALGNLVGSNLFDVAILGIDELAYRGPLLDSMESGHAVLFAAALAMTFLAWLGSKAPDRVSGRLVGAVMLAIYAGAQAATFVVS